MIPFSVLDLAPVGAGSTPGDALRNSLQLAQRAEQLGYRRYWVAEHHSMPGIASAATSVVIGFIAGGTKTIRVGAGGIMLPNHAPLVIAEQFGTLESLYPGRIDLGLGRAPGTDMATTYALRRDNKSTGDDFPQQVEELQHYFAPLTPGRRVRAVPGAGLAVPIWLLGSSLFSAQLAAKLGLPFAFASHFAPADLLQAVELYRSGFRASPQLQKPHVGLGINVVAADTDAEAQRIFTSHQQAFVMLRRGAPGQIPAPIDDISTFWTPAEQAMASQSLLCSAIGSPETVQRKLGKFIEVTAPDELFVTGLIY
ncbi:MAG TPA: LLM class flavin-dependent oxidoreductase, partial [Candidatus Dormibacteraeota bacterium]|nr:LLM class flavin-dependent oxidoreductase [Candidatus Dormibacteraeota bacterium]